MTNDEIDPTDYNRTIKNEPEASQLDPTFYELDVRARTTHALVPTELEFESEDPADILADPNLTTILPPIEQKPYERMVPLVDFLSPVVMAITPDNSEDEEDYKVWTPAEILAAPIPAEIYEQKFQVTDDGDVILTERDNMQFEHKPLDILSEGVVALPPE